MFRYFTPSDKWYEEKDFPGFTLQNSLDRENILIVETQYNDEKGVLVMVVNPYTLEIISETRVTISDPDFTIAEYDFNNDYYSNEYSTYSNIDSLPKIVWWNKGK